ncbi:hypothetical protein PoB_005822900 [Plakobranchus ocellatus]|uniref:Uncharacterized protein n=1 Tax=Plakobranchus ocellatus TaxID=259542 RepID=A0AAV4CL60_9GAST|nr:hypothetical protein PoB_005822900 [Plakobranchus ocellatus]
MNIPCQQNGALRFSVPPSGQGAIGGARTRNRRVLVDLRADSLSSVTDVPRKTRFEFLSFLYIASPQQGDLRLSGEPATEGSLQISERTRKQKNQVVRP